MSDLASWLTLARVPGVGAARFHALLRRFGSPSAALSASVEELTATEGLGPQIARAIRTCRDDAFADRQLRLLERHEARIVTFRDRSYPERLREIYDPPPLLFVSGGWEARDEQSVAIVGTRFTSAYGRKMTESFSAELSSYGFTVVSGMARGVDTLAHKTALRGDGRTVAVLGSGLDRPYPAENHRLMSSIRHHGAVMTEQPFGTGPDAVNFPQRNRIISGATLGTIVVEAGQRSGALITARFALDQGREVFAVPGPLNAPGSEGVNRLIKDGTAKLIQRVEDVIDELAPRLGFDPARIERKPPVPAFDLLPEEKAVYGRLSSEPEHIDQLASALALTSSQALGVLLALELKGAARQLPGMMFVRS
ncbi:MAG: DNA-processing protein DprA [Gemmatimonadetes bacterium]|nr:DNA-processing protein DprA [Gemmatimonadota bacterium]